MLAIQHDVVDVRPFVSADSVARYGDSGYVASVDNGEARVWHGYAVLVLPADAVTVLRHVPADGDAA